MPCIRKTRFDQDYFFKQQNKVILKENYKMEPNQKKANGLALIPFAVFVGVYLATGITLNAMGVEMAFYQLPTPIASFIGIIVAFAMFKGKFDDKLSVFLHGCGEENIMIMCMVFLFAGAFTSVSSAMGGVDSVVNLGMTFIPPQFIAAGVFVISAFISISTGTSVGTVTAVTPIALGLAQAGGLNQFLVVGATIGGSMFGDNSSCCTCNICFITDFRSSGNFTCSTGVLLQYYKSSAIHLRTGCITARCQCIRSSDWWNPVLRCYRSCNRKLFRAGTCQQCL